MNLPRARHLRSFVVLATLAWAWVAPAFAQQPVWKTAYVKRGFVGDFKAVWAGGVGAGIRMRTPLCVDGTQARVFVQGCSDQEVLLTKLSLVRAKDDAGAVSGPAYAVTFNGSPTLTVPKGFTEVVSDSINIPIIHGTWYVADRYASNVFPYAYDIDAGFYQKVGDAGEQQAPSGSIKGSRTGITRRIDVLTLDTRPLIACYGDSITQGYGSTPNAGHRYPDVLSRLADRPVLNLGINGDTLANNVGAFDVVSHLAGVDTVIFLMGINDIIAGERLHGADAYAQWAQRVIDGFHKHSLKVIWGTLPPAGGYAKFDLDTSKENLRKQINQWIVTSSGADAVVDFDIALADPAVRGHLQAEYQSGDWLHPSDAGYEKMAEAAATALKRLPPRKSVTPSAGSI